MFITALLTSKAPDRQLKGYIPSRPLPPFALNNKKIHLAPDILQHCQVKIVKYF